MLITEAAVKKLGPRSKLWDDKVRGFVARKQISDVVFYAVYNFHGRKRWYRIGAYGAPWTVDSARKRASSVLGDVADGLDPASARALDKKAPTVAEMAAQFLEHYAKPKLKAGTYTNYEYQVRLYIVPALGTRRPRSITHSDISRLHSSMAAKPYEANRVVALMSKLFGWAELEGYRDRGSNPCIGIQKYKEHRRERFLTDVELERLGKALTDCEAGGSETPWIIAAIRLLIFTGARLNEIATLKWEWVDLQRGLLLLPDSKTGRKAINLSEPAIAILKSLPRLTDNTYVVAGAKAGAHATNIRPRWEVIREAADLPAVRLHDLRHSFASIVAAQGGSLPMIGRLLGHSQPATTQRYVHLVGDPVKKLNDDVGRVLSAALKL